MGRVHDDLNYVTLNQLTVLTGKTYRTLKKLLADIPASDDESGSLLYQPKEVLPIIYGVVSSDGQPVASEQKVIDPAASKARLDDLRGDKVALEIEVMKGKLVPSDQVRAQWEKMASAFRSKILGMPTKVAPKLLNTKDLKEIESLLKAECREALEELSQYGTTETKP